jgi:thiol-disulfide isomerase/thioredoxin
MIQIVRGKISFKWPFLFVAFVGGTISAGTVSAQESNRDLGTILRDLSRAPVASLPMMEINAALEDSHASGRPTLILIKIPGCAPCEQFADTLEAMVAAGKMNQINLASAFASDPQAARFLKSQPQPTFPTWIVYRPAGGLDANKKPIPSMHYFVGNMAEPALVAALKKLDIDTTPTSAAGH